MSWIKDKGFVEGKKKPIKRKHLRIHATVDPGRQSGIKIQKSSYVQCFCEKKQARLGLQPALR